MENITNIDIFLIQLFIFFYFFYIFIDFINLYTYINKKNSLIRKIVFNRIKILFI